MAYKKSLGKRRIRENVKPCQRSTALTQMMKTFPVNSKKEDREDKVQRCVKELKEKHGQSYMSMPHRIWAELLSEGSVYLEAPTPSVMFV